MLVREVMTAPAVTVHASASVKEAMMLLEKHHITSMPVLDYTGRLAGVVSEADILRDMVRPDDRAHVRQVERPYEDPRQVGEVMSTLAMTVHADTDLSEAVELMMDSAVKSLPVVEDDQVIGVVSRSDVVHALARSDQRIRAEVDDLLRSTGYDWQAEVVDGVVFVSGPSGAAERRVADAVAGAVTGVLSVRVRGDLGPRESGRSPLLRGAQIDES